MRHFIAMLLCCISLTTAAQQKELDIRGIVYRRNATVRLANVTVTNMVTKVAVLNDQLGAFQIKAAIGDSLLFTCPGVSNQKVAVTADVALFVYMTPIIQLGEVTIKDMTKQQELQSVMKDYRQDGVYGNGKTSVLGAIVSPINGLYDLFGSGPKQARHFQKYASTEMAETEVDRRFTKLLVKQCTGLTDSVKVQNFMLSYRPNPADVRKWTDYDLMAYIKKSFKEFEASGEKSTYQKLF